MGEVERERKIVGFSGDLGMEAGRLYVQLRIPKVVDEGGSPEGGREMETVKAENRTEVCGLCGRTFRSKKALSGHMRVHVQNHRERTKKMCRELAAELSAVSSPLLAEGRPRTPACVVCGRTFTSANALYGHMRSHPDRGWRGVNLPFTDVKPEPVADLDRLTAVIPGWSVTGKRGRRCISSVESGSTARSEYEYLKTPKKGSDDISCPGGDADETEKCATVESRLIKVGNENPRAVPDYQSMKNRVIKRKIRALDEIACDQRTEEAAADVIVCVSADNYPCKTSKKSFTSPQSLGGHGSSCNKSKLWSGDAKPSPQQPQPQQDFSKATTTVGQATAMYHFPGLFSRLCYGNAVADFDLNELPTTEESEDDKESKPKVGDPCMPMPALVMGLSM